MRIDILKTNTGDLKKWASISFFHGQLIKIIIFGHQTQVHLNFNSIFTIEKVAITFTVSKDLMKILVDDYERDQDILNEARGWISKILEDLKEDQYAFDDKNGIIDVDRYDILDTNTGGGVMYVTRDTLTQIKGSSLETLFSGR